MMKLPENLDLKPHVSREIDPLAPDKLALWIEREQRKWERVLVPGRNETISENAFTWSEGISTHYDEYVRNTWLPKMLKPDLDNLIHGPEGKELVEIKESRQKIYLVLNQAGDSIEGFSEIAKQEIKDAEELGRDLFLIRGIDVIRGDAKAAIERIILPVEGKNEGINSAETIESITEKKILEVEDEMKNFERRFLPLISQLTDKDLYTALMNPFHLLNSNRNNPLRNYEVAKKHAESQNIPVEALMATMPMQTYFGYRIIEEDLLKKHGAMACAIPIQRSVGITREYDMKNHFHQLTLYHEMVHMMHHQRQRMRNLEEFIKFNCSGGNRLIINEEYDAYALEIEALNVLMNNALRMAAEKGEAVPPEQILSVLQCSEEYKTPATMLSMMAGHYFPNGKITRGILPKEYKDLVWKICEFDGFNLCEYGQPGVPLP